MEKDIALGKVGELKMSLSGGKIMIAAEAKADGGAVEVVASVSADAGVFLDQLKALVEAKLPAGQAIEESVFALMKAALVQL